jgi:hypothetical protein
MINTILETIDDEASQTRFVKKMKIDYYAYISKILQMYNNKFNINNFTILDKKIN